MVLPTAPPASLSVSQILTEFSIAPATQKRLSNDLFPLVNGTAGATCSLAASFSGQSAGQSYLMSSALPADGSFSQQLGVAVDSNGNIYVCGEYSASSTVSIYNLSLNPNSSSAGYSLPSTSGRRFAYLIKYNSSGVYQYSTVLAPNTNASAGRSVAIDSSNNVYWGGNYNAFPTIYNMTANPNTSSTGYILQNAGTYTAGFVIKYNSSGTYVSTLIVNSNGNNSSVINGITTSGTDLYCVGYSIGASVIYNMTANPLSSSSGYSLPSNAGVNAFIIKYNSSGTYQMSTSLASSGTSIGYSVNIDASGNIYWCGSYDTGVTLYTMTANPNTTSSGYGLTNSYATLSAFLLKYNSSGTFQGGTMLLISQSTFRSVATDSAGNVYVSGEYRSSPSLLNLSAPAGSGTGYSLPTSANSGGTSSSVLIKYNSSGSYVYSTTIRDSTYSSYGYSVTCDSSNNVYWCGGYLSVGSLTLYNMTANPNTTSSGYTLPSNANGPALLIKYNSSGTYQWAVTVPGTPAGGCSGNQVCVDATKNVYWVGFVFGTNVIYKPTANPNTVSSGYSLTSSTNVPFIIKYSP